MSNGRFAEFLILSGLTLLFLLAFQTLSETTFHFVEDIAMDSLYIIALIDATVVYCGLTIYSRKISKAKPRSVDVPETHFLGAGAVILVVFAVSVVILFLGVSAVPWDTVYWFDPPLNFQLVRDYFKANSFISLLLILTLTIILARRKSEPAYESDEKS